MNTMDNVQASLNLSSDFEKQLQDAVVKIVSDTARDVAKQTMTREYMDKSQLLVYLGISYSTLDTWIKENHLPYIKIGGKWVFKKSAVDNWYNNLLQSQQH